MGHGRGALLPWRKRLLGLQHLGALQIADLGRQALHRARHHAEGGEIDGVAVARDDLGRHRLDPHAEPLGDQRLDPRIDIGEGADGAGNGTGRDLVARQFEPLPGAVELGIGIGELEAEGGGLGMDAVAAPDGGRVFVLHGARLERREQPSTSPISNVGGAHQLDVEAGVEHVRGGHALMDEARLRPDDLGKMGEEGDDVVLDLALDGIDPLQVEADRAGLLPQTPRAASCGTTPSSAMASVACASISNQMRKRVSGDQMAAISGRV